MVSQWDIAVNAKSESNWVKPCALCGVASLISTKLDKDRWREYKLAYCCREHKVHYRARINKLIMADTNRRLASGRMREKNPSYSEVVRAKISSSLKLVGHHPKQRGGNGRKIPKPQQILGSILRWPMQYILITGISRTNNQQKLPGHYKLNIANPELRIAIEVDGTSHGAIAVQFADAKKENFLRDKGWKLLRVMNDEVIYDLEATLMKIHEAIKKGKVKHV